MVIAVKIFILAITTFFQQHPALLYGLAFLIGCGFALQPQGVLLVPSLILCIPFLLKPLQRTVAMRQLLAGLMLGVGILYTQSTIQLPDTHMTKEFYGTAIFDVEDITLLSKHYGRTWRYRGKIRTFTADNKQIAFNITATLQIPQNLLQPEADQSYLIHGTLRQVAPFRYILIPDKEKPWRAIPWTYSLAKLRFQAKQSLSKYIQAHIADPHTAAFLVGIATGDFQDKLISYEFNRFALQHIMAISGFHFAIVVMLLSLMLSFALPRQKAHLLLLFLLTFYFIFLGNSPSIMRAWVSSTLLLLSTLIARSGSGLNSLGVGLLVILINDPLAATSMGFQFSFAATAAILLLFSPLDTLLQKIFPKRPLGIAIQMDNVNQHAYMLLSWCRQGIALTFAVNSVALPLTFFYFLKFPLMGLLYNLFFPFMVSFSMVLLISGLIAGMLYAPFGSAIHTMNSAYTEFVLSYTYNMPTTLDYFWRVSPFSASIIIVQLTVLFLVGIWAKANAEKKRREMDDWAFA